MAYIYHNKDWPQFSWDMTALAGPLAAVRFRQGALIGRMGSLGFDLKEQAMLLALSEDTLRSSEIEGKVLDPAMVRSSIARRLGVDAGGLSATDREVDGVVEMMLDATQRANEPVTEERLFGWHAALFPAGRSGMNRIEVGRWRSDADGPMRVLSGPIGSERVHFEAPPAAQVPSLMRAFLEWFNREQPLDPVLKAGIAHLWFLTIHPFDDGNGRIARTLTDLQLARSEGITQRFYSFSQTILAERKAYYEVLERTQRGDLDLTEWLSWFLDTLARAIESADILLQGVLRKAQLWERLKNVPLNDRQRAMLNRLLDGFHGKLTASKWAKLQKCSHDTALRDINDLITKGILVKNASGGRSTSYGLGSDPDRSGLS